MKVVPSFNHKIAINFVRDDVTVSVFLARIIVD